MAILTSVHSCDEQEILITLLFHHPSHLHCGHHLQPLLHVDPAKTRRFFFEETETNSLSLNTGSQHDSRQVNPF